MGGPSKLTLAHHVRLSAQAAMRFSNVLEMSEEDAARLSKLLESDPLFQKLFRAQSKEWKIFSRQKFPGTHLSTSFYEIPERSTAPATQDIESVLEKHVDLIELIRGLGAENYERYFLREEGVTSVQEISSELHVTEEVVLKIRNLTDQVMMHPEYFSAYLPTTTSGSERYTCLAEYHTDAFGHPELSFRSLGMALGTYKVDYDRLKRLKESGSFSDKEKRSLQDMISMLEMINSRRTLVYRILSLIPKWQEPFFKSQDWDALVAFSQKSASLELNVTPAAVCRALQNRSVRVLNGEEVSLIYFFPSQKDIHKRKISEFIIQNSHKTDAEIRDTLEKDFGIRLSRRSVNVYKNEVLSEKRKRNLKMAA